MCMQDLAISRNVEWRRVQNATPVTLGATAFLAMPPSPIRVAAFAADPSTGSCVGIAWTPDGANAVALPSFAGSGASTQSVDARTFPGVFDFELLALNTTGQVQWWEAVPTTGLDHAVTGLSLQIAQGRP